MKRVNKNKGFTLIELLVAIVILGIIVAMAIPQISDLMDSNDKAKYKTYADTVETSAKLYTEAYNEDMFGNNESGCYDIPYEELSNKNLVKDININDVTCTGGTDKKTFVRVYKSDKTHYSYKVSILCTGKDDDTVQYSDIIEPDGVCDGTSIDTEGPTLAVGLESGNSIEGWMTGEGEKVVITVSDVYGLLENIKLRYAWSTSSTKSGVASTEWKNKTFNNERYEQTVSFKVNVPADKNDDYYLYVEPVMVRDANGNYTTDDKQFGPFRLDNTKPKCELRLDSEPTGTNDWYVVKPTVTLIASDEHGDVLTYGMAPKENPKNSDYEKKTSAIQEDTKGVVWSAYVTDQAGNKTTCKTTKIKVDTTPPNKPTGGSISVSGSTAEANVGAVNDQTDATSGFLESRYIIKYEDAKPAKTDSSFRASTEFTRECGKSYYAYAIAVDKAGNKSEVHYIGTDKDEANSYSDWGQCSKVCGKGTQTRTNTCELVTTELSQKCNDFACCAEGHIRYDDSACTGTCGTGSYTRTAYSSYYSKNTHRCEDFDTTSTCDTGIDCCSKTTPSYGNWGSCTGTCGTGTKYRDIIYTSDYTGAECSRTVNGDNTTCDTGIDCCASDHIKYQDGSCTGTCGTGSKTRTAYSDYFTGYTHRCSSYDTTASCNTGVDCCASDHIKYKDGSCTGTCGTGSYSRTAYSDYFSGYSHRCSSYDTTGSCDTGVSCCQDVYYTTAGTYCSSAGNYFGTAWTNLQVCTDEGTGCVAAQDPGSCRIMGGTYFYFRYCP